MSLLRLSAREHRWRDRLGFPALGQAISNANFLMSYGPFWGVYTHKKTPGPRSPRVLRERSSMSRFMRTKGSSAAGMPGAQALVISFKGGLSPRRMQQPANRAICHARLRAYLGVLAISGWPSTAVSSSSRRDAAEPMSLWVSLLPSKRVTITVTNVHLSRTSHPSGDLSSF
jgi:hypothetical protein